MSKAAGHEQSRFARFVSELYPRRVHLVDGVDDKGERIGFGMSEISRLDCHISRLQQGGDEPIVLEIDSIGGLREAAEYIRSVMERSNAPIYGLVTGECRSSAFYILQGCHERLALPNTRLRFHDMSRELVTKVYAHDDPEAIGRLATIAARRHILLMMPLREQIADNYRKKLTHLTREQILELMRDSNVITSEDALLLQFIDEVVTV